MSRRELREQIFKMLFRIEFHEGMEMEEQMQLFLEEEEEISKEDSEYIRNKYGNIVEHLEEIDASVNEKAKGWKTSRMAKVELSLIRLAVYEIQYDEDIPAGRSEPHRGERPPHHLRRTAEKGRKDGRFLLP